MSGSAAALLRHLRQFCYLEGATRDEAAARLGWPLGTLKRRLQKARRLLHERLTRRGLTLSAALVTALLTDASRAAVPAAPLRGVSGFGGTAGVSAPVAALAEGVIGSAGGLRWAALVGLVLAAGAGAGVLLQAGESVKPSAPVAEAKGDVTPNAPRPDRFGDPLPECAVARIGTLRFRHDGGVVQAIPTPDGKRIISCAGKFIYVWDAETGTGLHRWPAGSDMVTALAVSPDGRTIAAAGGDHLVRFWDTDGKLLREFSVLEEGAGPLQRPWLREIMFSPDGKTMVVAGPDESIRLFELPAGRRITRTLLAPNSLLGLSTVSADGSRLAVGLTNVEGVHQCAVYELPSLKERHRWSVREGSPLWIGFAPGADVLALGLVEEERRQLTLWDAKSGKLLRRLGEPFGPFGRVSWAFAGDGRTLYTGGTPADPTIRAWDWTTGEELRRLPATPGSCVVLGLLDEDGVLMARGYDHDSHTLHFYDTRAGRKVRDFEGLSGPAAVAGFLPGGNEVIVGDRVWDAFTGQAVRQVGTVGHALRNLSPDGAWLAEALHDGTVQVRDVRTNRVARQFVGPNPHPGGNLQYPSAVRLSPDGRTLAVVDRARFEMVLQLWDLQCGAKLHRWAVRSNDPGGLCFSPDGSTFAFAPSGTDPPRVRLWDVATGKPLPSLDEPGGGPVTHLTYSPDGRTLAGVQSATGNTGSKVHLWETSTRKLRRSIDHPGRIGPVTVSPDGRLVAGVTSGSTGVIEGGKPVDRGDPEETVCLWDAFTGELLHRFDGHCSGVTSLAFSPDGCLLASGGTDATALVWDVASVRKAKPVNDPILGAEELHSLWADLAGDDPAKAYRSIGRLVAAPQSSLPFLREGLAPPEPADADKIKRLIAGLGSDRFAERERASAELRKLGAAAGPALRRALEGKELSAEARRQVERLVAALGGDDLRVVRALEVLEHLGGHAEARGLLRALAESGGSARVAKEAKAALERLGRRD